MAEAKNRVENALAAYLDHLEMGGPAPDTSHLAAAEQLELQELIDGLELTRGVAFGRGRRDEMTSRAGDAGEAPLEAATQEGRTVLEELRGSLPAGARVEVDPNGLIARIGGIAVVDRAVVGTFGGRIRVWLLDVDAAEEIERNTDCLADLDRAFRMFPDTSAIALVGRELSCLVVEPEDCAPRIQVPSGSLMSRRYKRSIQPVGTAVAAFVDELIPYWDPIPVFDTAGGLRIDVSEISDDFVRAAIDTQRGIGERARKGNPKKDVLLALGKKEVTALTAVAKGLFDGSMSADEIEERIQKMAGTR